MRQLTSFRINAPRVVHQIIDGEAIIIDFDSGAYYSTDNTGALIWEQVDSGVPFDEIVRLLEQRYNGDRPEIESAVIHFLAELQHELLISPAAPDEFPRNTNLSFERVAQSTAARPPFEAPVLHKYTDMEDLLLLDPIHDVDEQGWPIRKGATSG